MNQIPSSRVLVEFGAKLSPDLFFSAVAPRVRQQETMRRYLICQGLDPNTTSVKRGTPLHYAIRFAETNAVKAFIEAEADSTARSTGKNFPNKAPKEVAEDVHHERSRQEVLDLLRHYLGE